MFYEKLASSKSSSKDNVLELMKVNKKIKKVRKEQRGVSLHAKKIQLRKELAELFKKRRSLTKSAALYTHMEKISRKRKDDDDDRMPEDNSMYTKVRRRSALQGAISAGLIGGGLTDMAQIGIVNKHNKALREGLGLGGGIIVAPKEKVEEYHKRSLLMTPDGKFSKKRLILPGIVGLGAAYGAKRLGDRKEQAYQERRKKKYSK